MDTSRLFRVDGMVAVITGGGTGLGFTMTKALAGAGAKKVYILGRRLAALEQAAAAHPNIVPIQCDVTDKAALQSAVDFVTKDVGYVNLFVANSGMVGPNEKWDHNLSIAELRKSLFENVSVDDFTSTLRVNVSGAFFSIVAFLELLDAGNKRALEGGFGGPTGKGSDVLSIQSQVVVTASIGGFSRHQFSRPSYMASKAAVVQLTKHASTNLARHGIRVNALAPGLFPSEMTSGDMKLLDPSKQGPQDDNFLPARKYGSEDETAGSILYLASKAGSFCNGTILVTDGGRLSVIPNSY
ncbi:hypothetical protein M426DRAFT_25708 [Hypoxylon sp. CI-4A]|nr:hypothetical protein M426DRAFT_25708 [Hypoxylon sp. CI-4A]